MAKTYIKDGNGDLKQIDVNDNGRASASNSAPVTISTEDLAAIGPTNETAPSTDTAVSGLNGRLQRVSQRITSLIGLLPASLGSKASSESLSVVLSSNHPNVPVALASGAATAENQNTIINALAGSLEVSVSGTDYETVASGQSEQTLGTSGASGDELVGLLVVPASTSPGSISIKDGSGSVITVFTGGTDSVSNLVPFTIALGIKSTSGAWKVSTGSNVSVIAIGAFS